LTARIRERSGVFHGGSATWYQPGVFPPQMTSATWWEKCGDLTGSRNDAHPLDIEWHTNLAWYAQGRQRVNGFGWTYGGYATTWSTPGHLLTSSPEPSDNEVYSRGLASTNPNAPVVDIPVFLAELREIPDLARYFTELGKKAFRQRPIRSLSDAYLAGRYGVGMFMKDLFTMLDFQTSVERRFREFQNMRNGKSGLGRKGKVWTDVSRNYFAAYLTPLYTEDNALIWEQTTETKKWVSIRWTPEESSFYTKTDIELLGLAKRVVLGQDLSFDTLYQAFPWSWMLDWYTNLGDSMSLTRNTVPVTYDACCLMRSQISRGEFHEIINFGGWSPISASARFPARFLSNKRRSLLAPTGPSLEFSLPLLNGNQLSTVAALAVQFFTAKG